MVWYSHGVASSSMMIYEPQNWYSTSVLGSIWPVTTLDILPTPDQATKFEPVSFIFTTTTIR